MRREHWTDRLSEYVDGALDASERAACEAHLAECPECAAVAAELREVAQVASLLPDVPPARDLWPGILDRLPAREAGLEPEPGESPAPAPGPARDPGVTPLSSRRRRISMTAPQLMAAAVALVALSAGTMWLALPGGAGGPAAPLAGDGGASLAAGSARTGPTPAVFAAAYNAAILDLETEFQRRRSELDPETIRVVESNLAIIDAAIAEANQALAADPASTFLNTHLANAMRQKVELLRRVATIEQSEI